MGYDTVSWSAGGRTMALVGAIPRAELEGIARKFQQAH
jgi:anti-sigma factor RsiW